MPNWVQHAVWWHVYPLGFLGADTTGTDTTGTDTTGPGRSLDRIADWLDYAVELGVSGLALGPIFASSTHGYDTVDYYRIDPRLGDEADFRALVAAAHDRGLRVLLDGVFNHVGRNFPEFQQILRSGTDTGWFRKDGAEFVTFEGHSGLVALNHRNPAVADFVTDVMRYWLGVGADGWRLDVAYAVPLEFWANVLPRVREQFPDAYFFGEIIHGDYGSFVREGGLDSVTQYELWKAIWSSLNDRNFFEFAWAMDRHNGYLEHFVPLTFVGNHDVTRLASILTDERHLPHALVILLTTGGTPSIYYGDEQAFRGLKEDRVGGDDAVRPTFPPEGPAALAPDGWPVYRLHQRLIGLRRRHSWLHRARTTTIELTNTRLVYETVDGDNRLLVALSLDDNTVELAVPGGTEVLDGTGALRDGTIELPPHGWAILRA